MKTKKFKLKELGEDPSFPFHINFSEIGDSYEEHTHDYMELVIITKGTGIQTINGRDYGVRSADVYVIQKRSKHAFSRAENIKLYNLMFDLEKINLPLEYLKRMEGFQSLFVVEPYYRKSRQQPSAFNLTPSSLAESERLISLIMEEYRIKKDGYEAQISAYLASLVTYLSRKYVSEKNEPSESVFRIARAIAYMEKNYTEPMSLDSIVSMTGISKRHFCRLFSENYNTSPIDYLINLRLRHACLLLSKSSLKITDVAYESGFSDSNYFSRAFRKQLGISPLEYRRTIIAS